MLFQMECVEKAWGSKWHPPPAIWGSANYLSVTSRHGKAACAALLWLIQKLHPGSLWCLALGLGWGTKASRASGLHTGVTLISESPLTWAKNNLSEKVSEDART